MRFCYSHNNTTHMCTTTRIFKTYTKVASCIRINHTCKHDTYSRPHASLSYQVLKILKFVHLLKSITFYNFYQAYTHVLEDNQKHPTRFQHAPAHIPLRPTYTSYIKSILQAHNEQQCNVFFSNSHQTAR